MSALWLVPVALLVLVVGTWLTYRRRPLREPVENDDGSGDFR